MVSGMPVAFLMAVAAQPPASPSPAVQPPAVQSPAVQPPAAPPPAVAAPSAAPAYGPSLPTPRKPPPKAAVAQCLPRTSEGNPPEIVVCAPQGYRLDPDVMEAKREIRSGGRPHNPHEAFRNNDCATIGPMGCRGGAGINLVAAAITAATMIQKALSGGNVGEMFVTDPQPDEYQLYVEAKHAREAKEAEQAAAAKAKAAAAANAAKTAGAPATDAASPTP
jgi:hypothetical protein